jgi:predicted enzyme related to lactoylglutathione lyase
MSERDHYPHGVPCWIEALQPDVDAALAFYGGVFGWEFDGPGPMAGDPSGGYYVAKLRDREVAGIAPMPPSAPGIAPTWMTHIAVDSVKEAAERALSAGGGVLASPFDAPPAGRMAVLADPSGAGFCVWEAGARRGAGIVNEPSAWAMSALSTADPEGAAAFYGAVFGWQTEAFGPEFTLFRLPGYVGGEPEQPVARDVVAAMSAGRDGAARWNVDVWVADTDATAVKARERGGAVLVGPHDVPGFRNAVIADPAGASMSISQLLAGAQGSG